MNYLIQRGKVRGQVINVPEGLPEILSDITREVLRCQPTTECLCQFIIDYLHSVIVTREKARVAQAIIERSLRIVDEVIADLCICDITKKKAEAMANTMEECFRRFLEKRRCEVRREKEVIKFEEEDMLDELIRRCKFSEHELKVSRPAIEEAYNRFVQAYMSATEGTDGTDALYDYLKKREEIRREEERRKSAAILIQANFRGWSTRRKLMSMEIPKPSLTPEELAEQDQAARRIQRFFRTRLRRLTTEAQIIPKLQGDICTPVSELSLEPEQIAIEPVAEEIVPDEEAVQSETAKPEPSTEAPPTDETPPTEVAEEPAIEEAPVEEPEPVVEEPVEEEPAPEEPPADEPPAEEEPAEGNDAPPAE